MIGNVGKYKEEPWRKFKGKPQIFVKTFQTKKFNI